MSQATHAPTTFVTGLTCRECGHREPATATHVCEVCFGPLEVAYDYARLRSVVTRERIEAGPRSLWRYADLLPVLDLDAPRVDLGAGFSPLVPAPRLGAALGLEDLWLKNDTQNPTFSFKDRVVSVALTAARALGFEVAACASTGNLAQSVAAHAAAHGMPAYVFIPSDLEQGKVVGAGSYGPELGAIDGTYADVNRVCGELASEKPWAFVNINVRPYYAEGSKTIGFEIAEQLGWELPDHVVAPMASGSMLVKIEKAFTELVDLGLVDGHPVRVSGAQAEGCSPIATAHADGTGAIRPQRPQTIAKSLAIGNPADGYYALDAVARTGGTMAAVSDAEIVDAMRLLASTEGIFGETAAGVTIAGLRRMIAAGAVERAGPTVAIISGLGLKTIDAVQDEVGVTLRVSKDYDEVEEALAGRMG